MQTLIGFFNCLFIITIVFYWNKHRERSSLDRFFIPALLIKIVAGIGVGLLYTQYYSGGDTINYFKGASILANLAYRSPSDYLLFLCNSNVADMDGLIYQDQPRALLMTKLTSIPAILTLKNYWISGVYFSLFNFYGMWKLASSLEKKFPSTFNLSAIAFLFIPSVVFWSSGVLKETVALGCIGYITAKFISVYFSGRISISGGIVALLFVVLLWQLKFYYAAILLPLLSIGLLLKYIINRSTFVRKNVWTQGAIGSAVLLVMYLLASQVYPPLSVEFILNQLVFNHNLYYTVYTSVPENMIQYQDLRPDLVSIIINFPTAVFSGLFRPLIFDTNHLLQHLVGLENTFLLFLSIVAFFQIFKIRSLDARLLLILSILYIVTLASLMAFAAPNFGTLMRYKTGFLPFLYYLVITGNLRWLASGLGFPEKIGNRDLTSF